MGKALGLMLWILTIGTVVLFAGHYWWFPEGISTIAPQIDTQFNRTLLVVAVAFCFAQVGLGYMVFRFGSHRDGPVHFTRGSNKLELTWTLLTAAVFVTLGILGQRVWAQVHFREAPANALTVEVTGQQFAWTYRYAGPDGKFGRTDPMLVDDSAGNPLGLDDRDPAAKDDIVTTSFVIPVNQPVQVKLHSKDVIHSFFVPVLRFKQDAVPGMEVKVHFTATKTGKYEIACAELCGQLHFNMRSQMEVLSESDFDNWLKQKSASQ